MSDVLRVSIQPLVESDIDEVMSIERQTFKSYWPAVAFINEITNNRLAFYFAARYEKILVGYTGIWIVLDEAHITTIAVHPEYRGKKIGEQLLFHLLAFASSKGSRWATLEVRESNQAAQNLYKKFGFLSVGIRKNYYMEENENAVIMWAGNLRGENFKLKLQKLKEPFDKGESDFQEIQPS
jgi:ribosomal-protein-alanine N-acetyltransferase